MDGLVDDKRTTVSVAHMRYTAEKSDTDPWDSWYVCPNGHTHYHYAVRNYKYQYWNEGFPELNSIIPYYPYDRESNIGYEDAEKVRKYTCAVT